MQNAAARIMTEPAVITPIMTNISSLPLVGVGVGVGVEDGDGFGVGGEEDMGQSDIVHSSGFVSAAGSQYRPHPAIVLMTGKANVSDAYVP